MSSGSVDIGGTTSNQSIIPSGPAGGDLTGTYPNPSLVTSGVTSSTYGSATLLIPQITVDVNGRITAASQARASKSFTAVVGSATMNTPAGVVIFDTAMAALTVTNALCSSASIVMATLQTVDATALLGEVVTSNGSFVITLSAAPAGPTKCGFLVIT